MTRKLEELCNFISGFAWPAENFSSVPVGLPIIRIQNVGNNGGAEKLLYWPDEYDNRFVVNNEDLLLTLSGSFRCAKWSNGQALLNQRVVRIIPKEELVDSGYLRFAISSRLQQIERMGRHALVNNVALVDLKNINIPFPSLVEQKRIAQVLDKADSIRRKREQSIKLMDDFLKSVFLDMFGDPMTNPKGWDVVKLENLADVVSGVTKGRKLEPSILVSSPYMRVANVQDGFIDVTEIKTIEVLPSDVEKYALRRGDVLLTEGGDPDKLGRGAVWYNQVENCIHQNHIFRVRPHSDSGLESEYLSALIGSEYGKRYFLRSAKQTTGIATINSTQLRAFPVLLPNKLLQQDFYLVVKNTRMMNAKFSELRYNSCQLFDALAHKLM